MNILFLHDHTIIQQMRSRMKDEVDAQDDDEEEDGGRGALWANLMDYPQIYNVFLGDQIALIY